MLGNVKEIEIIRASPSKDVSLVVCLDVIHSQKIVVVDQFLLI